MNTNPIADANKTSVDAVCGPTRQAFQGIQQLAALNLQLIKTSFAECAESTQAALSAKSPEEVVKLQIAALQAAPQKALAYGRQVKDIFITATAQQRAAAEAQVANAQAKFLDAVAAGLKNVPGSENAVALVKSAVDGTNNAYESMKNASKQVSDALAANVAKIAGNPLTASGNSPAAIDA